MDSVKEHVADTFLDGRAVALGTPFVDAHGNECEFNRLTSTEGVYRVKPPSGGPRYFRVRVSEMQ